jgi:hypothetical protein
VVRGQDDRTVMDHSLAMDNSEPKKNSRQEFAKVIADPVVGIQSALTDFHPLHL